MNLAAGNDELVLDTDASGWCQVVLHHAGQRWVLGAEVKRIVIERLLRGLEEIVPGNASGQIEGHDLVWILSLSEHHASFYVADLDRVRNLFIQGADGRLLARLDLDAEVRGIWREACSGLDELT